MIQTLYMKSGLVQLRLKCAQCGGLEFVDATTATGAKAVAKAHGWKFLRGDVFCGDQCNTEAKRGVKPFVRRDRTGEKP